MPFDGIFMKASISEIKEKLIGNRTDKIYQPGHDEIILVFRALRLLINAGSENPRICLTSSKSENPAAAPMFCMLLRKHLSGAKLTDIAQKDNDRICTLVFEARDEMGDTVQKNLIAELTGKNSNLVLTENGKIIDAVKRVDLSTSMFRQVLPGRNYTPPPDQDKKPVYEIDTDSFTDSLENDGTMLRKKLISEISGLSPLVAGELAYRCSGDGDILCENLDKDSLTVLSDELRVFSKTVREEIFIPSLVRIPSGKPDFTYLPVTRFGKDAVTVYPSVSSLLDDFYAERDRKERLREKSRDLSRVISSNTERLSKKLDMFRKQKEENESREIMSLYGQLVTANIYRIKKGDTVLEAEDYSTQTKITVPLDPMKTPSENAQNYFRLYRKSKTANEHIESESKKAAAELSYILSVSDSLSRCETAAEADEIRDELIAGGYIKTAGTRKKQREHKFLEYISSDGIRITAGKNNLQNDELRKQCSKKDIWFHVRDAAGAHVVLRCGDTEPPERSVLEAAGIAACLSCSGDGAKTLVDFTKLSFVKKIPDTHPGMVSYTNQTTVAVVPDSKTEKKLRAERQKNSD